MKTVLPVCVVIPTRNYGEFIGESIESVLNQTCLPQEVIVIDDGSDDNTGEIVKQYSTDVIYVFQDRKGVGAARNHGIEHSSCDYISHLDADDLWVPEKLEIQMEEFQKDPELEIAGGMMQPFYDPGMDDEQRQNIFCSDIPLPGFSASVILVKRDSFSKVGSYRADVNIGQDLDWFLRVREASLREKMVNRLLAYRRLHNSNSSMLCQSDRRNRIKMLKESLDRRREKI